MCYQLSSAVPVVCCREEVGTHWPELASCLVPPQPPGLGWDQHREQAEGQGRAPGEWVWREGLCLSPSPSSCWVALLGDRSYYGTDTDTVIVSPTVVAPREIRGPQCAQIHSFGVGIKCVLLILEVKGRQGEGGRNHSWVPREYRKWVHI